MYLAHRFTRAVAVRLLRVVTGVGLVAVSTAAGFGVSAVAAQGAQDACGYVPLNLINGDFEQPVISSSFADVDESTVPGWSTTATDRRIEIWRSGHNGVPSAVGEQFVELNANQVSTLYQDVPTVPGAEMNWALFHRGRLGEDVMKVQIGPAGGALVDQVPTGQTGPAISDGASAWGHHTGSYVVPAGQTLTRFAFVSVSSAGGDETFGNFLDGIVFGSPGCLKPGKTVEDVQGHAPVRRGDTLTYTVSASNPGKSQTTDSYITDAIPANTTFVPGSIKLISPAGSTTAVSDADGFVGGTGGKGGKVKVAIGTDGPPTAGGAVRSGETWKVTFQVTVDATAPAGADIVNSATAGWVPVPGTPARTSEPAVAVTRVERADLAAHKQASTTPVAPGGTFSYLIRVHNAGPDQARAVGISDPLPSKVSFVSSPDGCTATPGNGGTVSCGPEPTLAAGGTKAWTIIVKLDPSYTGDGSDQGNVATPSAVTPGTLTPSEPVYPPGPITPTAHLTTAKSTSALPVKPGETFTYTVTVTNQGPSTAVNVGATDPLPSKVSFVSSSDGCSGTAGNGGTVSCGPEATLLPGASKSWTFTVRLDHGYTGDGSDQGNVATATSPTGGGKDPSGSVEPPGPVMPEADLATVKTAVGTVPVKPGQTFDYRVTTANHGPSAAADVRVSDPLPEHLSFVSSADGCTGPVGTGGGVVVCGPLASLGAGASKSWSFTVRLDPAYTGDGSDLGNRATSQSDTPDPHPEDNTSPPAPVPGGKVMPGEADLSIAKVAHPPAGGRVLPGGTFQYTVTATNHGPAVAPNVRVSDPLPGMLSFVSSVSSPDGCTGPVGVLGGTVTCGPEAQLAPHASKAWTFTVRLAPTYKGDGSDIRNRATVGSDAVDPHPGDNSNDPNSARIRVAVAVATLPATGAAGLWQSSTLALAAVAAGGVLTYAARRRGEPRRS